jgi:hypothetical protein
MNGRHYFILEEMDQQQVKFIQGEQFTGILAGFFHKKMSVPTREGFVEMNRALKERAERLSRTKGPAIH